MPPAFAIASWVLRRFLPLAPWASSESAAAAWTCTCICMYVHGVHGMHGVHVCICVHVCMCPCVHGVAACAHVDVRACTCIVRVRGLGEREARYRVQGRGYQGTGSGVRVRGLGESRGGVDLGVQGAGYMAQGTGCSVYGHGAGYRVQGGVDLGVEVESGEWSEEEGDPPRVKDVVLDGRVLTGAGCEGEG